MESDLSDLNSEMINPIVPNVNDADSFKQWVYSTIEPYILTPALEVGSGGGSLSAIFSERGLRIRLSDKNQENRDLLRERFHGIENIRDIYSIDFYDPDFQSRYPTRFGTFGTVVALNVLENGFYDMEISANVRLFLRMRGRFIFFTPIRTTMLFGMKDNLGILDVHNKRYLKDLVKDGLEVFATHYVNLVVGSNKEPETPLGISALVVARRVS